jgi:hypothetical protein
MGDGRVIETEISYRTPRIKAKAANLNRSRDALDEEHKVVKAARQCADTVHSVKDVLHAPQPTQRSTRTDLPAFGFSSAVIPFPIPGDYPTVVAVVGSQKQKPTVTMSPIFLACLPKESSTSILTSNRSLIHRKFSPYILIGATLDIISNNHPEVLLLLVT